jgi:hypothetical protein
VISVLHVITRLALGGAAENTLRQLATLECAGYRAALAVGIAASEPRFVESARRRGAAAASSTSPRWTASPRPWRTCAPSPPWSA